MSNKDDKLSNKDPREVFRGKCSKCRDCLEYQYSAKSGKASCFYCECPAPAHERIENTLPEDNSIPVGLNQSVVISFTPSKHITTAGIGQVAASHDSALLIRVPHASDMTASPPVFVLQPQGNLLDVINNADNEINSDDVPMPNVLPDHLNIALANKKLNANHRSAICRTVVDKLIDEDKTTNDHLKIAAKKIRDKYSPMKVKTDPKGLSLYRKLVRTRDRKKNGPVKRPTAPKDSAPMSAVEAKESMIQDWASGKRSVTTMEPYLVATRTLRNKEASKAKSLELLVDFPALTIHSLLLKEFSAMEDIQLPLKDMRENWVKQLPNFRKYFKDMEIYRIDENFSVEQQTVIVLENLHRVPLWHKKTRPKRGENTETLADRASRVLEVFPENTSIAEARPNSKDPLRISGIGEAMGNVSFFAISDSEPIFTTDDPIDAMLLLLATYWVFHLNFGPANKHPILFLAACILGPVKIKAYISKNIKFLDLCQDHFDMIV